MNANDFGDTTSQAVISQMTSCLSHADTNINARVNNKRKCFYKNLQFETAKINNASHVNQIVQLHDSKSASQLVPVTRAKSSKACQCVRLFLYGFNAVVISSTKGWRNSLRCCITKMLIAPPINMSKTAYQ